MRKFVSKYDKAIALVFGLLTVTFIAIASKNETFFNWVYDRHQNQLSWFIRPLFLIPFCVFAYKRSWTGISITLFCLFTSMFWFSKPETVGKQIQSFLQFEKDWLNAEWDVTKWLFVLTVPVSFFALGFAFWKRSFLIGLVLIVLMATGKIIWSVYNAGEAGKSILKPAIVGLVICIALIFYGFKKIERNKTS